MVQPESGCSRLWADGGLRDRADSQGWQGHGCHWARPQGLPAIIMGPQEVHGMETEDSAGQEMTPGRQMKGRADSAGWRQETLKGRDASPRKLPHEGWFQGEGGGRGKSRKP